MNTKVSIIVPVYNAEEYLSKCIDSIKQQTYHNWECILVNDGSKDGSPSICDKYVQEDARFVVIHKGNGGVSSARNSGLERASGEWILFVDADDSLSINTLEQCCVIVQSNKLVEFIQFSLTRNIEELDSVVYSGYEQCSKNEFLNKFLQQVCIGGSFFKRSLLDQYGIHFDQKLKLAEDQLFIYEYLKVINGKVVNLNKYLYYYMYNEKSASNTSSYESMVVSTEKLCSFKEMNPVYKKRIDRTLAEYVGISIASNPYKSKENKDLYKKANLCIAKYLPLRYNIMIALLRLNPNMFGLVLHKLYNLKIKLK